VSLASAIYDGRVRHRRFAPRPHQFSYRLFMMYLDLDELPALFDGRLLWSARRAAPARFRRADHFGPPDEPLADSVRGLVRAETGRRPEGPIRLLTHLRYFGYCFNPVSFFYCYDAAGREVETIVAEVDNTPWGERHLYVCGPHVGGGTGTRRRYRFRKEFHVSPFMPMEIDYDWRFVCPGPRLAVQIENRREGSRLFDATLTLRRREVSTASLAGALLRFPPMTARVVGAIYWQALRLWLKRTPFFPHPMTLEGRP
jgi:hypothetical protein